MADAARNVKSSFTFTDAITNEELASSGVEAVIVGGIVPIVKITDRTFIGCIFMIPNSRISDCPESGEILVVDPVPVIKFGGGAFFVDVSQVEQ